MVWRAERRQGVRCLVRAAATAQRPPSSSFLSDLPAGRRVTRVYVVTNLSKGNSNLAMDYTFDHSDRIIIKYPWRACA